jgi:hypothetical protein
MLMSVDVCREPVINADELLDLIPDRIAHCPKQAMVESPSVPRATREGVDHEPLPLSNLRRDVRGIERLREIQVKADWQIFRSGDRRGALRVPHVNHSRGGAYTPGLKARRDGVRVLGS